MRLNAAFATLALSPNAGAALRGIAPLGFRPQSIDAARRLRAMDEGTYKPA